MPERLRLIIDKLDELPAGHACSVTYTTSGTSVPAVIIGIETGYDEFLKLPTEMQCFFSSDDTKNKEFLECYDKICRTVEQIKQKLPPTKLTTETNLPF